MERLLVVDDEIEMAQAVEAVLKRGGYSVEVAVSADEAIGKVRHSPYNLVITDLRMDRTDGIELMRMIHTASPGVPVVIMTAFGTVQNAVEAMKHGASDYILKPFAPDDLRLVVDKVLDSRRELSAAAGRSGFITRDVRLKQLIEMAVRIARSTSTVMITGESGTGKEVLARLIHSQSARSAGPFVAVNCAAIPDNLLESELFGYEKGAFTGAIASKPGKFELADRGTLLLDEIGEMSMLLQAKLLRVLQEREVDRVGGRRPTSVDIRVVATTNKDLGQLVRQGQFREDLFFRLNVVPLRIPPLRDRRGDIPLLAEHFLQQGAGTASRLYLTGEAMTRLEQYDWPGNVRELQNLIQRAVTIAESPAVGPDHLFVDERSAPSGGPAAPTTIGQMERQLILRTLDDLGGNRTRAARVLGISLRTLRNKLREYRMEA
ncbi:MAG: sigma-54-dependent Fis family transcriptional regulator [Acidobacteria bacterium]|nr:sigma-54-dependent Fis family transcriptional regulator [Acidobacteriota bacterium]